MKRLIKINKKNGSKTESFFSPLDKVTIFYILFSTVYLCLGVSYLPNTLWHFIYRMIVFGVVFLMAYWHKKNPNKPLEIARHFYPLIILNIFYPETSYLRNILINSDFDGFVSGCEQTIFGCQPSVEFCKAIPHDWFNELMHICYFSYYFFILLVCIVHFIKDRQESKKSIFIIVSAFYMYYIIFCFLPVVGPQFYFTPPDSSISSPYIFGKIIQYGAEIIEKPTGAFPSSHVGVIIIVAYITYKHMRKLFYVIWPFVIGICFATVYIKAHYAVDVFAGIISVPIFIAIANFIYSKISAKTAVGQDEFE